MADKTGDEARIVADSARAAGDTQRSVADTKRTEADHDRLESDHSREEANASAIGDLADTIGELNSLLIRMADTQVANASELRRSFRHLRWVARVAAAGVLAACLGVGALLLGVGRLNGIGEGNRRNGEILIDCTTPTPQPTPDDPSPPPHVCYERGVTATGTAVGDLRRSFDCVGWYFAGQRPLACIDVSSRLDAVGRGENPFATTTTTRP